VAAFRLGNCQQVISHANQIDCCGRIAAAGGHHALRLAHVDISPNTHDNNQAYEPKGASHPNDSSERLMIPFAALANV